MSESKWECIPAVLLSHRQEPLGSITPEDLEREGFNTLPEFKWYWQRRYRKLGWRPWDLVSVIEVRSWTEGFDESDDDSLKWAMWLLRELFGEWL